MVSMKVKEKNNVKTYLQILQKRYHVWYNSTKKYS